MANYRIGTGDPTITPDVGAGAWNSESKTIVVRLRKEAIYQILPQAYVIIGDDATKHMYHYFGNTGRDYTIDLEDLIDDVNDEKSEFEDEILRARRFVETLSVGTHDIMSQNATNGYIQKSENWNWFFAVGGYSYWGKGKAIISQNSGGEKVYKLEFEYKFFDRYNWDGGKEVEIFGITVTDEFMGEFHRQGLAQEFNMYGSIRRNIEWTGTTFDSPRITKPGGRN
jgi:hypothetical protein